MKKILLITFCLSILAMFGCALVDYPPVYDIRDNGQGSQLVNTHGKAHILEMEYWLLFPDHMEISLPYFNQNPAANRVTFFNYMLVTDALGQLPHDDLYCDPETPRRCVWFTATHPINNIIEFEPYNYNPNCFTVGFIYAHSTRVGECGRDLPLADEVSLLNKGEIGTYGDDEGLYYDLNRTNFSITLENEYGQTFNVPILTDFRIFYCPRKNYVVIDLTNPIFGCMLNWYADWLDESVTDLTTVHFSYSGISHSFMIAGKTGFDSDMYRNAANKLY